MSKHKNFSFSKSLLPPDAQRITKPKEGTRVWLIGGMEFESKREYFMWVSMQRHSKANQPSEAAPAAVKLCECDEPQPIDITPEWCATCGGKIMPPAELKIPEFGAEIPFDPPLPSVEDVQ